MASASSAGQVPCEHTEEYICQSCITVISKYYGQLMEKFWEKMNTTVYKDTLDLGYTSKLGTVLFQSETSLEVSTSDTSEPDEVLKIKKNRRCLKPIVTLIPDTTGSSVSKNDASVFFLVENLNYVDMESVLKLIQYFKHFWREDYETLKGQLKCSNELPFLIIYDFVLYNEESIQHNHSLIPIGLQMKANIYPNKKLKKINSVSPVEMKLTNIQTFIRIECGQRFSYGHNPSYLRDFVRSDANDLKDDVGVLFTDICGDIKITHKTDIAICRFPNVETTIKVNIPHVILQVSRVSDIVFAIENYNIFYISNFIQNYLDLIVDDNNREKMFGKPPSRWALSFISLEKCIGHPSGTKEFLFIGFFYKAIRKSILQTPESVRKIPLKRISFEKKDKSRTKKTHLH